MWWRISVWKSLKPFYILYLLLSFIYLTIFPFLSILLVILLCFHCFNVSISHVPLVSNCLTIICKTLWTPSISLDILYLRCETLYFTSWTVSVISRRERCDVMKIFLGFFSSCEFCSSCWKTTFKLHPTSSIQETTFNFNDVLFKVSCRFPEQSDSLNESGLSPMTCSKSVMWCNDSRYGSEAAPVVVRIV